MPTGYTAKIAEGISFPEFAMSCARAFGALITLRDSPDAPIPDKFKPDYFYKKELYAAEDELRNVFNMTNAEADAAALKEYEDSERTRIELNNKDAALLFKYKTMLYEVMKWEPPSQDHIDLKQFMIKQIRDSINFDCGHDYNPAQQMSGSEWRRKRIDSLREKILRYTAEFGDEVERVNKRNKWLKELRDSLKSSDVSKL